MRQVVFNGRIRNVCCIEQLIMDLWAENVVPDSVYDVLIEYIKELREEANETTRRINTDLQAYESELSEHNTLFQDLNDNLYRIVLETQKKDEEGKHSRFGQRVPKRHSQPLLSRPPTRAVSGQRPK